MVSFSELGEDADIWPREALCFRGHLSSYSGGCCSRWCVRSPMSGIARAVRAVHAVIVPKC